MENLEKHIPSTKHGIKNPLFGISGSYVVIDSKTSMTYIGSTANLAKRISQTTSSLRRGYHKNKRLQETYNSGADLHYFVIRTSDLRSAVAIEQNLVNELKDSGVLCNIAVDNVEKTRSGAKLTEAHIALLRESNIGKKRSEESIKKMSEAQKAYSLTDEGRARIARNRELHSRKVSIEGIDYSSISEASRLLKIPYTSLVRRYGL